MNLTIQAFKYSGYTIPDDIIATIPKADRKNLVAYVAAQEGESAPLDLTDKNAISLSWPRKIIQAMKGALDNVKFFVGHGRGTNSHNNRQPVGKVVKSFLDTVDGKLSNIVIGSFDKKPKEDVVSIESVVATTIDNIVSEVKNITAIAMGRSDEVSPAFDGARKLAEIQAFRPVIKQRRVQHMGTETAFGADYNSEGVKSYIRKTKSLPSTVGFESIESLQEDNRLWPKVERYFSDTFQQEKVKLDKEVKELRDKVKVFETKEATKEGKVLLEKKLEKNISPKLKEFILDAWEESPTDDFTDEGIDKFVKKNKDKYDTFVKKYGTPEDDDKGNKTSPENDLTAAEEEIGDLLDGLDETDQE